MQKRSLKTFICMTTVLAIIGVMIVSESYSADANIDEDYIFKADDRIDDEVTLIVTSEVTSEQITESDITKIESAEPVDLKEPSEIYSTMEPEKDNNTLYSASQFMQLGTIHWSGWKWTWYSERVLPGDGLDIPGRHNDIDGYICDENSYICLSSSSLNRGTVVDTPFGKQGKVYDTGCASNVIDVYVNW